MTCKRTKFSFQKREDSTASYHCCVPKCTGSARCNSVLSFHTFPKDGELQKKWVINIRRDCFKITDHTRVCSRHFSPADLIEPSTAGGRRRLKKGAVPVLFEWNGYSLPAARPGVWDRTERPNTPDLPDDNEPVMEVDRNDHDYCSTTEPGAVDLALGETEGLQSELSKLRRQMEEMAISCKFGLERFASSDDDIRFYTR